MKKPSVDEMQGIFTPEWKPPHSKRKACDILEEARVVCFAVKGSSSEPQLNAIAALIEEARTAVNRLTAAYEVGSEVRCQKCDVNGGMRLVVICKHCGARKE